MTLAMTSIFLAQFLKHNIALAFGHYKVLFKVHSFAIASNSLWFSVCQKRSPPNVKMRCKLHGCLSLREGGREKNPQKKSSVTKWLLPVLSSTFPNVLKYSLCSDIHQKVNISHVSFSPRSIFILKMNS